MRRTIWKFPLVLALRQTERLLHSPLVAHIIVLIALIAMAIVVGYAAVEGKEAVLVALVAIPLILLVGFLVGTAFVDVVAFWWHRGLTA